MDQHLPVSIRWRHDDEAMTWHLRCPDPQVFLDIESVSWGTVSGLEENSHLPPKRSWRILEVFEVFQKIIVRPNQKEEVLNMEADAVQDGETY